MAEPSLGEITSIRPEATVNPGVVLEGGQEMVRTINQSAQFNAEMKQRQYTQSLGYLKDIFQDIGKVNAMPIMDEDRPVINKKLADIYKEIGNDPRAALAGNKYAKIQKDLGEVSALATQSKQDNIYDEFHRKYLASDPSLDTPENRQRIESHGKAPLGQRQKYMLETPPKFDAQAAMGNILKQKNVAIPYANSEISSDNKFITRETGTRYDRAAALQTWNQGYDFGTDQNGQPIKKWAEQQFEKVKNNPEQMEQLGNPKDAKEFYENFGATMFGSKEDIVGEKTSTQVANPYEMMGEKQRNALYMEGIKEGNKEKLAAVKKNLEQQGVPENSNFLINQYANVLGNTTGQEMSTYVNGKYEKEQVINVDNSILKKWATTQKETLKSGGTLDPVTETIITGDMPDVKTRTKDGNIRYTYYKKYQKGDKIPAGKNVGDPVLSSDGTRILESTGIIPRRQILTTLGAPVIEKKILAPTIEEADKYLKGHGNEDLDRINSGETTPVEEREKPVPSSKPKPDQSYNVKGKKYTHSQLNKLGYSDEDINAAIKAGTIKP